MAMKCGLIVRREANFQLPRSFFGIGLASPLSFKAIIGEIRNMFFSLILRVGPCHKDHPFQSHELNCHNSVAHTSGLVMSHRDAKRWRYWRYISAVFFSWC